MWYKGEKHLGDVAQTKLGGCEYAADGGCHHKAAPNFVGYEGRRGGNAILYGGGGGRKGPTVGKDPAGPPLRGGQGHCRFGYQVAHAVDDDRLQRQGKSLAHDRVL